MAERNPLDDESTSDIFLPNLKADQANGAVRQCHVLVIAGDRTEFEVIVRHLKTTNGVDFQPTYAAGLAAGLEFLAKGGAHVVLLCLDLPDSRGLATLQKLRFHAPQVPVVVLADVDDESLATEAASEGAQDYLLKGELHRGLLMRSIRYSVSRNRSRAKLARTVQELRESERRFKVMFENATDGILLADAETKQFQTGNQKICQMLACSLDELRTLRVSDIHPKEDLPHVMDQFEKQRKKEITLAREIPVRRRDETVFYADINSAPVVLDRRTYLLGVFRDVTDRRRAEEELRKHREQLEDLVKERTAQLTKANEELRCEIAERHRTEKQLKASLGEKEVLLKEIHHRVKNNMQVISSLLSLQSRRIVNEQTREILQDTRSRVASMAIVHEQLYQSPDLAELDFAKHVRSLASYLFRLHGIATGAVAFREDIADVPLALEMAIPCGLIINELVSNALKHAFPDGMEGEIRVGLNREGDQYTLVVFDNGAGFPADLDFHSAASMGLQVVTTLAEQLNGTIELDRDGGTTVKITFPKSKQR